MVKRRSGCARRMAERRPHQPHFGAPLAAMRAQGMSGWAACCILHFLFLFLFVCFSFFIFYGGFRALGLELP